MSGYLYLPRTAGNYASTPDIAAHNPSTTLDVRVKQAADDYTPAATDCIICKDAYPAAQRAWNFRFQIDGSLFLEHSSDGSAMTVRASTFGTGFTDGTTHWLRALLTLASGDVSFYTSDDNTNDHSAVTWTQLGTTVSGSGAVTIFDSTDGIQIGQLGASAVPYGGNILAAAVVVDGTVVLDADFTDLTTAEIAAKAFTEDSSNTATVTLNGTAWTYIRDVTGIGPEDLNAIKSMLNSPTDTELLGYLDEIGASSASEIAGALNELNSTSNVGFREAWDTWIASMATTGPGA